MCTKFVRNRSKSADRSEPAVVYTAAYAEFEAALAAYLAGGDTAVIGDVVRGALRVVVLACRVCGLQGRDLRRDKSL